MAEEAKRLMFPPDLAPYIDWDALGKMSDQLACNLHAYRQKSGIVIVVLSWDDEDIDVSQVAQS